MACNRDYILRPIPALEITKFNGKIICGRRAGKTFEKVIRPDPQTGLCPTDTTACSPKTSVENRVCYPDNEYESSCPITDIFITS